MQIGTLDRRAELQHQTAQRNTRGEALPVFTTYASVWANREDQNGKEFFAAQQMNTESPTIFVIRWRSDVAKSDRIVVDGNTYNIRSIAEIPRRRGLTLMTTAVPT